MKNNRLKKEVIIILLILIAIVSGVYVYVSYQKVCSKNDYKADYFGLANDDILEIDEEQEITTYFELTQDEFEGLLLFLQFDGEMNNQEMIIFRLSDVENDELLADYKLDLAYEASGQYAYIPLTVNNAKNKKVCLSITGENIVNKPSVMLSKTCNTESKLYVNGKKKSTDIVMRAVYADIVNEGMDLIFNYIIFVLGLFIISWFIFKKDIRVKSKSKTSKNKCKCIVNKLLGYRKIIEILIIVVILISSAAFVYNVSIKKTISEKKMITVMKKSKNQSFVLDKNTKSLKQTIKVDENDLSALCFEIKAKDASHNAKMLVEILDFNSKKCYFSKIISVNELNQKFRVYKCKFNEIHKRSKNTILNMMVTPIDFEEDKVYIYKTNDDKYKSNILEVDSLEKRYDLAIKLEYKNFDGLKTLYEFLVVYLLVFVLLVYYLLNIKQYSIYKVYPLLVFFIGVLYCFVITVYGVPDEPSHIDTVYGYSNKLLGVPDAERVGYVYKRVCDVDLLANSNSADRTSVDKYAYQRLFQQFGNRAEDVTLVESYNRHNTNAGALYYFPMIFGMSLGRLFGFNTMTILIIGRLFSVIIYTCVTALVLKKLPMLKSTFILISLFPMTMQQVASYSYDTVIMEIAFLFVAFSLDLIYVKREYSTLEIAIVTILGVLLAQVKGGTYIPLCFILFLILIREYKTNIKNVIGFVSIMLLCTLSFLKDNILSIVRLITKEQGASFGGSANHELYTLDYLMEDPGQLLVLYINTLFERGDYYIQTLLGGKLAWLNLDISWVYLISILFLVFISLGIQEDGDYSDIKLSFCDRGWYLIVSIGSFLLVQLSMLLVWTSINETFITGVQGRYFLPFIFVFLLSFKNRLFVESKIKENHLAIAMLIVQVMVIFRIVAVAVT